MVVVFWKSAADRLWKQKGEQIRQSIPKHSKAQQNTAKYRKDGKTKKEKTKTRKKRQELSVSATKAIKKEDVEIIVKFN